MNKKLLTAAIAAVIAAPTAALANDVTIYGVIHASVDYRTDGSDFKWSLANPGVTDRDVSGWGASYSDDGALDGFDIASRATRIGFKGSEDLANGLKAIWKIEAQADIADRGGSCYSPYLNTVAPFGATSPTVNQGTGGGYPNISVYRAFVRGNFDGYPTPEGMDAAALYYGENAVNGNKVPPFSSTSGPTVNKCDSADWWTARNAYIGLAGGWGTFLVGRHDTPYKMSTASMDLFADTLADYNSTIGLVDIRTNSAIAYVSPSWSGLSFAGAVVAPHIYANDGDFKADADGLAEAYSVALSYNNYGFNASIAYENISADWVKAWANIPSFGSLIGDNEKMRVGLGWTGAGFTIGGIYEWEDNLLGLEKGTDGERWQIQAGYTFGNNMIKAMYGQGDFTGSWQCYDCEAALVADRDRISGDNSAWAVGIDHNFSKRTKAYMLYTNVDYTQEWKDQRTSVSSNGGPGTVTSSWETRANAKLDGNTGGFSIGMIHSF